MTIYSVGTKVVDQTELKNFGEADLFTIEDMSRGMEADEILQLYGLEKVSDLNEYEQKWFKIAFNRGRAKGKQAAVDEVFKEMKGKAGLNASLAYLNRFCDPWKGKEEDIVPASGGFTLKVVQSD